VHDRAGGVDLALWCQSRMAEGGIVPPHSVLAPGTALGLLRSRALSSVQADCVVAQGQRTLESHRDKKETERTTIRPGCSIRVALQLEIPPVWVNSNVSLDAAATARQGGGQAVRRGEWSGPDGEEFALDSSASAEPCPAELLAITVSGTLRRNVSGAIASAKNDRNFPQRRQPRRIQE
jgi:hypothetical protein